jgi:hypothetical protein
MLTDTIKVYQANIADPPKVAVYFTTLNHDSRGVQIHAELNPERIYASSDVITHDRGFKSGAML